MVGIALEIAIVVSRSLRLVFRHPSRILLDLAWKAGFLLLIVLLEAQVLVWLLSRIPVPDAALTSTLNLLVWIRLFWDSEKQTLLALGTFATIFPVLLWFPVEAFFRSGLSGPETFGRNLRQGFFRFLFSRSTRAFVLTSVIALVGLTLRGPGTDWGQVMVISAAALMAVVLTLVETIVRGQGLAEFGRRPEILIPALLALMLADWGLLLSTVMASAFLLVHLPSAPFTGTALLASILLFGAISQTALVLSRYSAAAIIGSDDGLI